MLGLEFLDLRCWGLKLRVQGVCRGGFGVSA